MKLNQLESTDKIYNRLHDFHTTTVNSIQTILNEFYPNGLDLTSIKDELEADGLETNVPICNEGYIRTISHDSFTDAYDNRVKYTESTLEMLLEIYDFLCDYVEHDKGIALPQTVCEIIQDGQLGFQPTAIVCDFISKRYDNIKFESVDGIRNAYNEWFMNNFAND